MMKSFKSPASAWRAAMVCALTVSFGMATAPARAAVTLLSNSGFISVGGPVDLTALGTTNWIQLDGVNPTAVNAKKAGLSAGAPGFISTPTAVGTGNIAAGNQVVPGFTWSDGAPSTSGANDPNNWQMFGPGNGFTFKVVLPAASVDIVNVYLGAYGANTDFKITQGATALVDTKGLSSGGNSGGYFQEVLRNSGAAAETVTFTYVEIGANVGSFDNVKIGGVSLISVSK